MYLHRQDCQQFLLQLLLLLTTQHTGQGRRHTCIGLQTDKRQWPQLFCNKCATHKKKAITINYETFFILIFTLLISPFWFVGQKVTQPWKIVGKGFQKKLSDLLDKWNKNMGGRSFVITCGAFEDTLMWGGSFWMVWKNWAFIVKEQLELSSIPVGVFIS